MSEIERERDTHTHTHRVVILKENVNCQSESTEIDRESKPYGIIM